MRPSKDPLSSFALKSDKSEALELSSVVAHRPCRTPKLIEDLGYSLEAPWPFRDCYSICETNRTRITHGRIDPYREMIHDR
jgi:hypothetical protein